MIVVAITQHAGFSYHAREPKMVFIIFPNHKPDLHASRLIQPDLFVAPQASRRAFHFIRRDVASHFGEGSGERIARRVALTFPHKSRFQSIHFQIRDAPAACQMNTFDNFGSGSKSVAGTSFLPKLDAF